MRVCVVLYFHNDRWIKRALSVVFEELDKGNSPVVLDVGRYATPNFGAFYRALSRVSPTLFPLKRLLDEIGVEYVDLGSINGNGNRPPPSLAESFELGISSHCYSLLRTDLIGETAYGRSVVRKMTSRSLICYDKSYEFFSEQEFRTVFIPNFRYSAQKAPMLAAIHLGLKLRFFEAEGQINLDKYRNHDYPVHDRVAAQKHALEVTDKLSDYELREYASNFIETRFGVSPIENEFSLNWSENSGRVFLSELQKRRGRKIGIFTSSVEEMWGLGGDWEAGWDTQWQAIEAVLRLGYLKDDIFVLRVHPNLGNKERRYFKREQRAIRRLSTQFPNLMIVQHNSDLDSYQLIEILDLVVVFSSTIGLEATLKGKPVLRLAPTFYDLLIKCPAAENEFSLSNLREDQLFQYSGWQGAARYVAYKELRSKYLHSKVPLKKRFDYVIPIIGIPLSSLPVGFEPLRYSFVIRQWFFRKIQNRRRTIA